MTRTALLTATGLALFVGGCTRVLWRIPGGPLLAEPKRNGEPACFVVCTGQGGPGGVALGQSHFHSYKRIRFTTGQVAQHFTTRARLPYYALAMIPNGEEVTTVAPVYYEPRLRIWTGRDPFGMDARQRALKIDLPPALNDEDAEWGVLSFYAPPLIGVRRSAGAFAGYRFSLSGGDVQAYLWPCERGSAIRTVGDRAIVIGDTDIRGCTLDGEELWRQKSAYEIAAQRGPTGDVKSDRFVTAIGGAGWFGIAMQTEYLRCRSIDDGRELWTVRVPSLAAITQCLAIGNRVVAFYTLPAANVAGDAVVRRQYCWQVYGAAGESVAGGQTDDVDGSDWCWLTPHVLGAGLGYDLDSGEFVVGGRTGGVAVLRSGVQRIPSMPGLPQALSDGVAVLEDSGALIGVRLSDLLDSGRESGEPREVGRSRTSTRGSAQM